MDKLTPEKIEELRGLLAKATPGPWEADNENNEGCYGLGDDCHEGFQSASIHAPDGRGGYVKLFDALNSDAAFIEEEWDEDWHHAWDEVSRANAALIVAMRNALPAMLDALATSLAREGEDGEPLSSAPTICARFCQIGHANPQSSSRGAIPMTDLIARLREAKEIQE